MKSRHFFWGLFFITLGVLVLLKNLGTVNLEFGDIWKFWPVVLVLWGIIFLVSNTIFRGFISGFSGIILAIALFAFFNSTFLCHNIIIDGDDGISIDSRSSAEYSFYNEEYSNSINSAKLNVESGAGSFKISDTTGSLFAAKTYGAKNSYVLSRSDSRENSTVDFEMKNHRFSLSDGSLQNNVNMMLNTRPIWDMDFKLGAASIDFDLSPYKIDNISIKMGVASLNIKLGSKSDKTNLFLDAGASSVDISVPENVGCEIIANVSLSSKDFEGFTKINKNTYRTENFDSSSKIIILHLKSGLASIDVKRYNEDL